MCIRDRKYPSLFLKTIFIFLFTLLTYQLSLGQNATNGGTIGDNQTIFSGAQPDTIINIQSASGGDSSLTIEYLWFQGNPNFEAATGINNQPFYIPPPLTQTTFYIRNARRVGFTSYQAGSNLITITVDSISSVLAIENSINHYYPNPVIDFLQIEFKNDSSPNWKVEIFDIKGSLQKTISLKNVNSVQTINLQSVSYTHLTLPTTPYV